MNIFLHYLVNFESVKIGFSGVNRTLGDGGSAISPWSAELSDSVPMNHNSFSIELVSELDGDRVAGPGSDRRPGKLTVDPHHYAFFAIRGPKHVLYFPLIVSDF